jgi:hypothetical protein
MKEKQFILNEIRRLAMTKGGESLGMRTFQRETGIAEHEWRGVHWPRWTDAVVEAGLKPLERTAAFSAEEILFQLANLTRKIGRYPTTAEMLIAGRGNKEFPGQRPIVKRLGDKVEVFQMVRDYCASREDFEDVSAILNQESGNKNIENGLNKTRIGAGKSKPSGYVYLVKSGKLYKIGCSENHWRRKSELHKQTSEGISEVHTISALDDAPGIERYWHERFKEKRQHGEWFDLSPDDIRAFKKRKFM